MIGLHASLNMKFSIEYEDLGMVVALWKLHRPKMLVA